MQKTHSNRVKKNAHTMSVWYKSRAGFSLLEVLLAVAILALLAVPLAQTLISSSQLNSKAKDVGIASDISETVIDTVQALKLGDVLTEINGYSTDNVGNPLFNKETGEGYSFLSNALAGYSVDETYEIIPHCKNCNDRVTLEEIKDKKCDQCGRPIDETSLVYVEAKKQSDPDVMYDSDITSSIKTRTTKGGVVRTYFTGNDDDMYDFVLENVQTKSSGFDVHVHVEPEQKLSVADINSMSQSNVISVVQKKDMEDDVADEFYRAHLLYKALNPSAQDVDVQWIKANMTRNAIIEARKDVSKDSAVVTIKNVYTAPSGIVDSSDKTITKVVGSFTTNSTAELVKGAYYYFYPLGNSTASRDTITISNHDNVAMNLYFVAMETPVILQYNPKLTISQGESDVLSISSNIPERQWDSIPTGVTIKDLGNVKEEQTMYSVGVSVYTHKAANFEENKFVPQTKYLLVQSPATVLDSSEKFSLNVDLELKGVPTGDEELEAGPNTSVVVPKKYAEAHTKVFKYDGESHSIKEDNGVNVIWGGTTEATEAGTYIATVKPVQGSTWPNGTEITKELTWVIERDNSLRLEVAGQDGNPPVIYNKQPQTGVKLLYNGEQVKEEAVIQKLVTITGSITETDAGQYTATVTPNQNYAWEDGTSDTHVVKWVLNRKPVTLTWDIGMDKDTWYYDEQDHHGNCVVGNVQPGDTCLPIYKDNVINAIGTKTVTITGLSNDNYELPQKETTHDLHVIGAMVSNITMNPDTSTTQLVYNGTLQTGVEDYVGVSITGQDTAIDAGEYTIIATPLPGYAWDKDGNDTNPREFTWTIHKKVAEIEWGELTWVYDGTEHNTTCNVKNADEVTPCTVIISNNAIVNVGTQDVTATPSNTNYEIRVEDRDRTLTVTLAKDSEYTINEPTVYDGTTHKFGTGSHIVVTGIAEDTEAGTYTIKIKPQPNHAWADGTTTEKTEQWTIKHSPTAQYKADDYAYTGRTIIGVTYEHCEASGTDRAIEIGAYDINLTPSKNYCWADETRDTQPVEWKIFGNTIPKPDYVDPLLNFGNPITSYEYSGHAWSPLVSSMDGTLPMNDTAWDNNPYYYVTKDSTREATDVGTYKVTIKLKDSNARWSDGTNNDIVFNWTITKRDITIKTISHDLIASGGRKTETYTDKRLFPAEENSVTKEVAHSKVWDDNTFASLFVVPSAATTDMPNDDIVMTKDTIYTYNFDYKAPICETEPIADGQKIYYTISDDTKAYKTAGVHEYIVTAIVKDSSGKDVTSNYNITYDYAWLMIHQAAINPATDITNPVPVNLTYNTQLQNLVKAGTCIYGTLEYTMDGTANSGEDYWLTYNGNNWKTTAGAENTGWSKTIPQGIYAGEYKVYWRVDADENQYDYTNHPDDQVDVTINRATQSITLDKSSTTFCYAYNVNNTGHVSSYGTINVPSWYETVDMTMTNTELVNASCPGVTSGPVKSGTNKVVVYASAVGTQGTATITLSCPETANYTAATTTCTISIVNHNQQYSHDDPTRTCTRDGTSHYYCQWCKNHTTSFLGHWGHNMTSQVTQQPTCTSPGTTRHYCTRGDYSYNVSAPAALGHSFTTDNKSPDCITSGYSKTYCTRCGYVSSYTTKAALGHSSFSVNGSCCGCYYICSRCGRRSGGAANSHGHGSGCWSYRYMRYIDGGGGGNFTTQRVSYCPH